MPLTKQELNELKEIKKLKKNEMAEALLFEKKKTALLSARVENTHLEVNEKDNTIKELTKEMANTASRAKVKEADNYKKISDLRANVSSMEIERNKALQMVNETTLFGWFKNFLKFVKRRYL